MESDPHTSHRGELARLARISAHSPAVHAPWLTSVLQRRWQFKAKLVTEPKWSDTLELTYDFQTRTGADSLQCTAV